MSSPLPSLHRVVLLMLLALLGATWVPIALANRYPDSVIVHGSRLQAHTTGEYKLYTAGEAFKGVTSEPDSRGLVGLIINGRPVYKHECRPLYMYYVTKPVIDGDGEGTEFWLIAPYLRRKAGYAQSHHRRMHPQSDGSTHTLDVWKSYNVNTKKWQNDTLTVHATKTCEIYKLSGAEMPENLAGEYKRQGMKMEQGRPVYVRNDGTNSIFLHFNRHRSVWSVSTDLQGKLVAMWLNADCASPDCGVTVQWWLPTLSKCRGSCSNCRPRRSLVKISVQVQCLKRDYRLKSEKQKTCGRQILHKVGPVMYKGTICELGKWPWMVSLFEDDPARNVYKFVCSGSLISPRKILTSAHCFKDKMSVVVRAADLHNRSAEGSMTYKIRRKVKHPGYLHHKTAHNFEVRNDIMVVELESDVSLDDAVQPLCLPNSLDSLLYDVFPLTGAGSPYVNCYAAGWGVDGKVQAGYKLKQLSAGRMINMDQCVDTAYSRYQWARTGKSSCVYFGKNSKYGKICNGDSGSPLFCQRRDSDRWTVVGVASWVSRMCQNVEYIPSVYADVTEQLSFIYDNLY